MKKALLLAVLIISMTLSTLAFILGTKIIAKTQSPPDISITYPAGYLDLPEKTTPPKKVHKKVAKP